MRLSTIAPVLTGVAIGFTAAPASGQALSWLPDGARAVLSCVQTGNPQIAAAFLQSRVEFDRARAHDGFYQPRVSVAAGATRGPSAAPESLLASRIGGEAASAQAGLLVPLRAGAYLGVGAAQRYLFEADGFEDLGQSAVGVRFEIPLLQNRGFRSQILNQAALDAAAIAAHDASRTVRQQIARDALVLYANWIYAAADVRESTRAVERVSRLLEETRGRVDMQTVPAYQIFSAQMEVAFRQEELRLSQSLLQQAGHSLASVLGGGAVDERSVDPALLRPWASLCATTGVERLMELTVDRPERMQAVQAVEAAEALAGAAREALRSNLALAGGVGYQAEDENGGLGRDDLLSDPRGGAEIALVWSRPLAFDAEEARVRAQEAAVASARAALRGVELEIAAEQARARAVLAAARDRLGMVDQAVGEAQRALAAEEQRLALGEGRSRNVLDAQKDLTDAERRANVAALDMIVAFTQMLHAAGVPLLSSEENDHGPLDPAA